MALAVRGRSGAGALDPTVIAVGFDGGYDTVTSEGWGADLDAQAAETVGMAAAQAHNLSGIQYAVVSVVLSTTAPADDVRVAVVEDVQRGLRSRAMSLSVGVDGPYIAATQEPVLSWSEGEDPRPLVLADVYGPEGDPFSVVWAGGPGRVVRLVSDPGTSRERTRTETADDDGFVTLAARAVTVLSITTASGEVSWSAAP